MPIPGQTLTRRDPGLGGVPQAATTACYLGTSSSGVVDTLVSYSRKSDVVDALGQGPLVEDLCRHLDLVGGPVYGMRVTGSVAAAAGSVTKTAVGSSTGTVTVAAQVPYDAYEVIVEITVTGALGTGQFRYSLDDGRTYSPSLVIPAGGTYLIPNTNVTMTFVVGAGPVFFEDGDTHEFDCTAPYYSTANVATAVAALLASLNEFAYLVLVGEPASTSDGAAMFAALATHLASFRSAYRYIRGIVMDAGTDTTTNAISDFAASASQGIVVCYGDADIASSKPFVGWGSPKRSLVSLVGPKIGQMALSEDGARLNSGPLTGVLSVSHNEFINEEVDQHKFTTARTFAGRTGFWLTNINMKSAVGSDYEFWQHSAMMAVAETVVHTKQQEFLSIGVATNGDGTIQEGDAVRLEAIVLEVLRATFLEPVDVEGNSGHVAAVDYKIDRANNLLSTKTLLATVAIQPKAYVKQVATTIGYAQILISDVATAA